MRITRFHSDRGSTLIAVFWIIAILTFAVFTATKLIVTDIETELGYRQAFEAEQLVDRGIALAANPIVKKWDPLLQQVDDTGTGGFTVKIRSEGSRLNLNAILLANDNSLAMRLFQDGWGLERDEAEMVYASMIDWIDQDDLEITNGAEAEFYEKELGVLNQPFNRPFQTLEEIALVRGMGLVSQRYPQWQEDLTLWSGSGRLDVNDADARMIALVCECTLSSAIFLVNYRSGSDGILDTEDDVRLESASQTLQLLGVAGALEEIIGPRLTFEDPVVRIESVARVGDYGLKREMVLRREESRPTILFLKDIVLD